MRCLILILFLQIPLFTWADEVFRRGANNPISSAMGNILHCSPHHENPAIASTIEQRNIYASFHNDYGVEELSEWNISLLLPSQWLTHNLIFKHFGFKDFNHTDIYYGVGKRLSNHWHLGTTIHYQHLYFAGCQEEGNFLYNDIGLCYTTTVNFRVALLFRNTFAAQLNSDETRAIEGRSLLLSSSFNLLDNAQWNAEIEEFALKEWEVRNGFKFSYNHFTIRCGFSLLPVIPSVGCGFAIKDLLLDISSYYHNQLGYSLAIGIGYKL